MQIKKRTTIKILFFLLVAIIAFTGCGRNNIKFDFAEVIDGENLDDITLTVYYMHFWSLTPIPVTLESLIDGWYNYKTVIFGSELKEHFNLLKKINNDTLIPARAWERSFGTNIRIYYVLESSVNGKLLDVVMWGRNGNVIFNGREVKMNPIFYDMVIPFLPGYIVAHMERWRDELASDSN